MTVEIFEVHEHNPQLRLIEKAAALVRRGGVIVYPTDSCYALGCLIENREGVKRIRQIRRLAENHNFTLAVRDLKEISRYAVVSDSAFRVLKRTTPGPFTFLLNATKEVPRILHHPKRKTIGLRIPAHPAVQTLLDSLSAPLLTTSLILPDEEWPLGDPDEIVLRTAKLVDAVILAGWGGTIPTTVLDLCGNRPEVVRQGLGTL